MGNIKPHNLVSAGQQFGWLTVLDPGLHLPPLPSQASKGWAGHRAALCRCICGNQHLTRWGTLTRGQAISCGCYQRKLAAQKAAHLGEILTTHGLSDHPLYPTWTGIIRRCTNPQSRSYRNYGARGIGVHSAWCADPTQFIVYVVTTLGPRPQGRTLDRIDNDGNYEPGNLRWATASEQNQNKRTKAA